MMPQDLVDSLREGRVSLFVGSGASCAAGLIGWDTLIEEMKTIIRSENTTFSPIDLDTFLRDADHLDVADVFRTTVQDHRYFSFLRAQYRKSVRLSRLHRTLTKLPVKTIFTTNYDKLLESSFRDANSRDSAVIIFPQQLGIIGEGEPRVIKLHGDIDHPSTIVLTRTDYANYSVRHKEFEFELHRSINDRSILFVGFGLRDSNFRRIYQDARSLYDSGRRLAYAIMTGTNSVERRLWEKDGLKIIPVARRDDVVAAIRTLANGC